MTQTCESCWCWVAAEQLLRNQELLQAGEGECRRHAPRGSTGNAYFYDDTASKMAALSYPWPVTFKSDWCAEYERKA